MLTFLTMSMVLAAPAPGVSTKPAPEPAGNKPPRIIEVKSDDQGKIKVSVTREVKFDGNGPGNANIVINGNGGGIAINGNAGAGVVVIGPAVAPGGGGPVGLANVRGKMTKVEMAELSEVKDLKIQTVSGKEVSLEEAKKLLTKGGFVIAPADGKKIDSKFLKLFAPDVLILMSPELVATATFPGSIEDIAVGQAFPGIALPALPAVPVPVPVPPAPPVKE